MDKEEGRTAGSWRASPGGRNLLNISSQDGEK